MNNVNRCALEYVTFEDIFQKALQKAVDMNKLLTKKMIHT